MCQKGNGNTAFWEVLDLIQLPIKTELLPSPHPPPPTPANNPYKRTLLNKQQTGTFRSYRQKSLGVSFTQ